MSTMGENSQRWDAVGRYNQLIDNFHQERNLLFEYETLVTPKQAALHALEWNEREQQDDIQRLQEDIQLCDHEINDLKEQVRSKQQLITNAKISQSMRLAQISRLSGLSQPIELDQTYFFVDRFPPNTSSPPSRNTSQLRTEINVHKTENLQRLGIMKTGEGVLLEARLQEVSKLLEGHIFSFHSMASTININPNNHIFNTNPQIVKLREQAEKNLTEFERTEQRVLATVIEILTLRLEMIRMQRDAIENDHSLTLLERKYEQVKKEYDEKLTKGIDDLRERYSREYRLRDEQYDREIFKLESNLEKTSKRTEKYGKKSKIKEEKLKDECQKMKERFDQLKSRHRLEMEGYRNETRGLQQRLQHVCQIIRNRQRHLQREQFRHSSRSDFLPWDMTGREDNEDLDQSFEERNEHFRNDDDEDEEREEERYEEEGSERA